MWRRAAVRSLVCALFATLMAWAWAATPPIRAYEPKPTPCCGGAVQDGMPLNYAKACLAS